MHGGWDDVVTLIKKDWDILVRPTLCRRGNARLVGGFLCLFAFARFFCCFHCQQAVWIDGGEALALPPVPLAQEGLWEMSSGGGRREQEPLSRAV